MNSRNPTASRQALISPDQKEVNATERNYVEIAHVHVRLSCESANLKSYFRLHRKSRYLRNAYSRRERDTRDPGFTRRSCSSSEAKLRAVHAISLSKRKPTTAWIIGLVTRNSNYQLDRHEVSSIRHARQSFQSYGSFLR